MRHLALACLGLAFAGCSTLTETTHELANPGSAYKARQAANNLKCREYGLVPDTAEFGNCMEMLEQARS
jgi:hypothetical protein